MHEVLVNRLGGLSLPRKSVVRLTDRPDMILDVYRGRKTTIQQQQQQQQVNVTGMFMIDVLIKKSTDCPGRNFSSTQLRLILSQKGNIDFISLQINIF